jgi:hypothetical protein
MVEDPPEYIVSLNAKNILALRSSEDKEGEWIDHYMASCYVEFPFNEYARMAELADAPDSKSGSRKRVGVRPSLWAPSVHNLLVNVIWGLLVSGLDGDLTAPEAETNQTSRNPS